MEETKPVSIKYIIHELVDDLQSVLLQKYIDSRFMCHPQNLCSKYFKDPQLRATHFIFVVN